MEKTLKKIVLLLALLITSAMFTSCSDDKNEPEQPIGNASIIGTWTQTNNYGVVIDITFNANKKGQIVYTHPSGTTNIEYFEYVFNIDTDGDAYLRVLSEDCQLEGSYDCYVTPTMLTLETYSSNGHIVYQFKRK